MSVTRKLQLLRSNATYANFSAAKAAISALTGQPDGSIVLGRYGDATNGYYSAIGVYDEGHTKWTVFKSSDEIEAAILALQTELDNTQTGAGLGTGGAYTAPASGEAGYEIISDGTAATNLNGAINKVADYVYDTITAMDYSLNVNGASDSATTLTKSDASKVVSAINQTDGQIAAGTTAAKDLLLTGYTKDTTATGSIAATDTIEGALSKLENSVSAVGVSSPDGTINVSNDGREVGVNIDEETIVSGSGGVLSTNLTILKETTGLDANVREQYKLVYGSSTTAIGDVIKVYKDSALNNVYVGHVDDALTGADAQGESATTAITSGTGAEALCFVYHLENDKYKLETVNVEAFLQESEFGNGLDVDSTNHTVSVKAYDGITVDSNGVSVTTGDGLELTGTSPNKAVAVKIDSSDDQSTYLSVSSAGVALDGDAIDAKISGARTAITEVAAGTETTADGTSFIKVVKTAGSGQTPDSYAVSTQGIKDYVAGEIADLDGSAVASSATNVDNAPTGDFKVLTSVVESDGVILSTTDTNGSTAVNLKKVAATGAAADVSYSNTTSGLTATTVQAAVDELDGRIDALGTDALESVTSANAGIAVGTKANHSQELTLTLDDSTTGGGTDGTGTNNALSITSDGLFLSSTWDCGTWGTSGS